MLRGLENMEESAGSQYALHIALQTLKERCQNLQQRLFVLEEENISLRVKCNKIDSKESSPSEVDTLKARITQLTEQKAKLKYNISVVDKENKQLWSRLSNLMQVNKSLGSHLTKINESLNQHNKKSNQLIRSNTFTQSDPKTVLENNKISLELEDISLKLISNIAKEKSELEAQCSEMAEMQNTVVTNSFGFSYLSDDVSNSLVEEFEQHLNDLRSMKDVLLEQREKLQENITNINIINENIPCKTCSREVMNKINDREEENQLESLARWGTPDNSNVFPHGNRRKSICPMCSKIYDFSEEDVFYKHVESHFSETSEKT